MIMVSDVNKLRLGLKFLQDGEPCVIISSEFVKPGKGQSFTRVKFRKFLSGKVLEKTFKSGESVKLADIEEIDLLYLYNDGVYWYFMNSITFEQVSVCFKIVQDSIKWLTERLFYTVVFWNANPICLIPPHIIALEVVNIQPAIKGDTISSATKLAVLSTGVVIKVPLFIKIGEVIKINTRSSEYVSRVR